MRLKEFDTGFDDSDLVQKVISDVNKSKKKKEAGEPYKTANEMLEEYSITMEQLKSIIKADTDANKLVCEGFILSGKTKIVNGKVVRAYCRAGELMVHSIEEAYKKLGFRVPITGEYLIATPSEGWGGSH